MKVKQTSGVLDKAITILDTLMETDGPVSLTELSKMTKLNVTTVYRTAGVLLNHGYLRKVEGTGKYSIGFKFLKINNFLMKWLNVRDVSYPIMEKLSAITGESVNLAIQDANEAVYISHIESNRMLRTFTVLGNRVPLYSTGVGKIFCAYMSESNLYQLMMKAPFSRFTQNTLTDFASLEKELVAIKSEGVAMDNGEMDIDVRCIAAPIMDSTGKVVASVSLSGPYTRLSAQRIDELKPVLKKYASQISAAMGFSYDQPDG
jgi:IclR family KDG regulon transcriptional repressor